MAAQTTGSSSTMRTRFMSAPDTEDTPLAFDRTQLIYASHFVPSDFALLPTLSVFGCAHNHRLKAGHVCGSRVAEKCGAGTQSMRRSMVINTDA